MLFVVDVYRLGQPAQLSDFVRQGCRARHTIREKLLHIGRVASSTSFVPLYRTPGVVFRKAETDGVPLAFRFCPELRLATKKTAHTPTIKQDVRQKVSRVAGSPFASGNHGHGFVCASDCVESSLTNLLSSLLISKSCSGECSWATRASSASASAFWPFRRYAWPN